MATYTDETKEDLLYNLYIMHVKNQIHEKIKLEIQKVIDKAVDDAVDSLSVQLHSDYNYMMDQKTFKFIIEKK
jgi:hypothetical protein